MSRLSCAPSNDGTGFPRVSGDEPEAVAPLMSSRSFSPRERG